MSEQPDEMVDAYLRHLLQGGQAPDLAGMDARDRADLERTFTLLDAIAGIDPDLVPPYEDDAVARALGLSPPAPASDAADTRRRITREIERLRRGALVLPDEEAAELPDARSDLLVRVGGARIRVAIVGPGELAHPEELLREADRLFYRFPETAAVALVAGDEDLSCLVVEPQDSRPAIDGPAGGAAPPAPAACAGGRSDELPARDRAGLGRAGEDRRGGRSRVRRGGGGRRDRHGSGPAPQGRGVTSQDPRQGDRLRSAGRVRG